MAYKKNQISNTTLLLLSVTFFVIIGFLLALSAIQNSSLPMAISKIMRCYYFPYVNSNTIGTLEGANFHLIVYGLFLIAVILFFILKKIFIRHTPQENIFKDYVFIPSIGSIFLIIVIFMQTINHTKVFKNEWNIFSKMSLEEKNAFINKDSYSFAAFCKKHLTGPCQGDFVSDWDIHKEPYMGIHRQLAYFLYPDIDIRRTQKKKETNCIVFFNKKNAAQFVPDDFQISATFDTNNLLAIRKKQ